MSVQATRLWNWGAYEYSGNFQIAVAALEAEVKDCSKDVSELDSSETTLKDNLKADEIHLKDVLDIRTLQAARISSLEGE